MARSPTFSLARSFTTPGAATRSGWLGAAAAGAMALGVCALVVRQQTKKAEREFPPKGHFIEVEGVQLHYLSYGKDDAAQTVVLLHGNGTMGEEFDISGLVRQVAQRYRVLVFDRPGYGYSERPADRSWGPQQQADLIDAALRQLGVRSPVVLGHSWGALVALAMGERHPDNVAALVLASGYYTPSLRLDVPWFSLPALPVVGTLMRYTISPLLGRLLWPLMVRRMFSPEAATQAFKQRYPVWMSLRPSQLQASAAETAWMIPSALALRRHHRDMTVPTVVIAGADDRLLSTRWNSVRLNERLPHSSLRTVQGQGHMVHHTATDEVMKAIDEAAAKARSRLLAGHPSESVTPSGKILGIDPRARMAAAQSAPSTSS